MKRFLRPSTFFSNLIYCLGFGSYIADLTMDACGVLVLETATIVYNRDRGV